MKSKVRRHIDRWVKQALKDRQPIYITEAQVFMWPSSSDLDTMHVVVAWTEKEGIERFMCSCKGFYMNEEDACRHTRELQKQLEELKSTLYV